jgi:hypothetical protein
VRFPAVAHAGAGGCAVKKNQGGSPERRDGRPAVTGPVPSSKPRFQKPEAPSGTPEAESRTITEAQGDLRQLELHREWVAPDRSRRLRLRLRNAATAVAGTLLVLAAIAAALYFLIWRPLQDDRSPFSRWFARPSASASPTQAP